MLALKKFVFTVKRIKIFVGDISQIIGLRKYQQSRTVDQDFQELTSTFDKHMKDLRFNVYHFQIEKDNEFLDKIGSGITDPDHKINNNISEIFALKNTFEKEKDVHHSSQSQIISIICDEFLKIDDYNPPETSRGKVVKRIRKVDGFEFSFKEIPTSHIILNAEVSILKRINNCQEILKFFGLAKERDVLYLVTEWAELGNLKEYYKKYMLYFDLKLKFALDVTRGLNFLVSVKIFHNDIRSDNILITNDNNNKRAKIAYFGLSREFADATRNIGIDIQKIRYMAPEKLLDSKYKKYDIKCEVYSLGMLLWEIAELKTPYEDEIDISKIYNKITKEQCREKFSYGGVPQEWKDLVKETWNQNPKYRPSFTDIFHTIQELNEQKFNLLDININSTNEFHIQEPETFLNFDEFDDISVEEAIDEFNKNDGNKLKAWKCFNAYANIGTQLFKEAADGDVVDAQLMYGDCIFNGVGANKDAIGAIKYYRMAAENDNPVAMFKVGHIYYHGDSVEQDLVEGEKFLKLAAYSRQKQAIEMCKKYNIKL
ncbi:kinase-like domain-containing protein [Gigaspora rosea]|uniref:Kinase-like domain-containing protein n=1 Tax=Gigaspora rosea TaxID=44941 RepID=A0A397UN24_9GLOM|nr:kinase-like domain-containing protein [Gigaspora rosea]